MTRINQSLSRQLSQYAAAALCLAAVSLFAAHAAAQAVQSEVVVILAKDAPEEIDPSLKDIEALKKPPFSAYKSMKVLTRNAIKLEAGTPASVELPNGRTLQLSLLEKTADGRFKVQVSINKPDKKDYLPLLQVIASAGEPFFVAGQSFQGGTLVIGVRVGERPAKPAK